ncbi:MAG: hypothetical protein HEQ39_16100 [Rhizobacter sp.]
MRATRHFDKLSANGGGTASSSPPFGLTVKVEAGQVSLNQEELRTLALEPFVATACKAGAKEEKT